MIGIDSKDKIGFWEAIIDEVGSQVVYLAITIVVLLIAFLLIRR